MMPAPLPVVPDVLVIGGGLIGLATAVAAAERGFSVRVVSATHAGEASGAAAGMLAPSIDRTQGATHDFAVAARDRYPAYLTWLRERSGIDVPLNRDGIIQVALSDAGVRGLRRALPADACWLERRELTALEPALAHALGGALHPADGAVDNGRLLEALRTAAGREPRVSFTTDSVVHLRFQPDVVATGISGSAYHAGRVVLAAGAWSSTIGGLPRAIPVEPVRGQMLAYPTAPLRRVVYGPTGYLVPRSDGRTLVGATVERAGYESLTTHQGIARLRRTAAEILPELATVAPAEAWAGLRPVSRDQQPILGFDPEEPRLLYATGHSRNGVLMTPLTADCVVALLAGDAPPADIGPFGVERFASE